MAPQITWLAESSRQICTKLQATTAFIVDMDGTKTCLFLIGELLSAIASASEINHFS